MLISRDRVKGGNKPSESVKLGLSSQVKKEPSSDQQQLKEIRVYKLTAFALTTRQYQTGDLRGQFTQF